MKGIIVEVARVSMLRFRFNSTKLFVQRCPIYLLQIHVLIGAVVPVWFGKHPSISKPVWHKLTEPDVLSLFFLPSGHARTQPARAFPAQTVKTGWTLIYRRAVYPRLIFSNHDFF